MKEHENVYERMREFKSWCESFDYWRNAIKEQAEKLGIDLSKIELVGVQKELPQLWGNSGRRKES